MKYILVPFAILLLVLAAAPPKNRPIAELKFERAFGSIPFFSAKVNGVEPLQLRANPQSIGLVGMEVLRRFKVIFDYSRSRMYLEPNRSLAEPFVYDVSGVKLRANGPSFSPPYVSSVRAASPGSEAGIESGDVLSEINGRTTSGLSLEKVREILGRPGETHRLTLLRKETTVKAVLKTRELLN